MTFSRTTAIVPTTVDTRPVYPPNNSEPERIPPDRVEAMNEVRSSSLQAPLIRLISLLSFPINVVSCTISLIDTVRYPLHFKLLSLIHFATQHKRNKICMSSLRKPNWRTCRNVPNMLFASSKTSGEWPMFPTLSRAGWLPRKSCTSRQTIRGLPNGPGKISRRMRPPRANKTRSQRCGFACVHFFPLFFLTSCLEPCSTTHLLLRRIQITNLSRRQSKIWSSFGPSVLRLRPTRTGRLDSQKASTGKEV